MVKATIYERGTAEEFGVIFRVTEESLTGVHGEQVIESVLREVGHSLRVRRNNLLCHRDGHTSDPNGWYCTRCHALLQEPGGVE